MHKENCTKHEALKKCEAMIIGEAQEISETVMQGKEQFLQRCLPILRMQYTTAHRQSNTYKAEV